MRRRSPSNSPMMCGQKEILRLRSWVQCVARVLKMPGRLLKRGQLEHKRAKRKAAARRAYVMAVMRVGARRLALADGRATSVFSEPDKQVFTVPESIEYLRIDTVHPHDEKAQYDCLMRLVDARHQLRPVVFAGHGGGRRLFTRAELNAFLERLSG